MPARDESSINPAPRSRGRGSVGTTYLVSLAFYAVRMRIEQAFKPYRVTGLQYSILKVVSNNERLSSAELSRYFYVSPQNMGQLLSGLEGRGLISRAEDEDNRRILRISMTGEGKRLVGVCDAEMATIEAEVYQDFSPADIEQFRDMLRRITRSVRSTKVA